MATPRVTRSTEELWDLSIEELLQPMTEMPRLGGPGPFVINLSTATAPLEVSPQMAAAFAPECLYMIQRTEDRRMRFRLRLGPFATEDAADAMLIKVREIYPCALTATAADDDMRAIAALQTRASAARAPVAPQAAAPQAVAPQAAAPPTAAPAAGAPQAAAPTTAQPRPAATPTPTPSVRPTRSVQPPYPVPPTPAADAPPLRATAPQPAPQSVPGGASLSAPNAAPPAARPRPPLTPSAVSAGAPNRAPVMPSAPRVATPVRQPMPMAAPPRAATAAAPAARTPSLESTQTVRALTPRELDAEQEPRWFAIQLCVAERPFDPDELPSLDIFNVYRLYSVAGHDQGRVRHALRLGFFSEEIAARAVASYLAGYYDNASVQRVSLAERDRFGQRRVEARKDVGATGNHAVIEITGERIVRPKRSPGVDTGAPAR